MSEPRENKRQRAGEAQAPSDDNEVQVTKVVAPPPLQQVYVACSCNYPLQNDKWGESSGHETEDTQILGVYARSKDANAHARSETHLDQDESSDNDDDCSDAESKETELFYWQDDEPTEWTARRVWVEVQTVQY